VKTEFCLVAADVRRAAAAKSGDIVPMNWLRRHRVPYFQNVLLIKDLRTFWRGAFIGRLTGAKSGDIEPMNQSGRGLPHSKT